MLESCWKRNGVVIWRHWLLIDTQALPLYHFDVVIRLDRVSIEGGFDTFLEDF